MKITFLRFIENVMSERHRTDFARYRRCRRRRQEYLAAIVIYVILAASLPILIDDQTALLALRATLGMLCLFVYLGIIRVSGEMKVLRCRNCQNAGEPIRDSRISAIRANRVVSHGLVRTALNVCICITSVAAVCAFIEEDYNEAMALFFAYHVISLFDCNWTVGLSMSRHLRDIEVGSGPMITGVNTQLNP